MDKYSLKVTLEPMNACRICLPKIATHYKVQRKTSKKELEFFWNPLTEEIEPLVKSPQLKSLVSGDSRKKQLING